MAMKKKKKKIEKRRINLYLLRKYLAQNREQEIIHFKVNEILFGLWNNFSTQSTARATLQSHE